MGWAEKAVKGSLRLIVVTPNGVEEGERCAVVHQTVARADTPKRRRSHTVGRRKSLCDVDRPQVVQQEVAERMELPATYPIRYLKRIAVDPGAHRLRE